MEIVLLTLLKNLRLLHEQHAELSQFCDFPDDIALQDVTPYHVPAADLMRAETGFIPSPYDDLCQSLHDVSSKMQWRETYKGSNIASDFMERFGCFEIIGHDAPFASTLMRSFLVYQPPQLHYPWHQHPAEEIYVVLNGAAEFAMEGSASRRLTAGESSFHPSNHPHALTTLEDPVLAYVVWRNEFDVPPVWTNPSAPK